MQFNTLVKDAVEETLEERANAASMKKKLGRLKNDLKSGSRLKKKSFRWKTRGGKKLAKGKGLTRGKVKKMGRRLMKTSKRTKSRRSTTAKINRNRFKGLKKMMNTVRGKIKRKGGVIRY